jgi:hypothetical protein
MDKKPNPTTAEKKPAETAKLVWNDKNMRSQYANVANVTGGREEIVIVFGLNQAWKPGQTEIEVELTDRIVMNPFAAKRLAILLTGALKAYENNFGKIELAGAPESVKGK